MGIAPILELCITIANLNSLINSKEASCPSVISVSPPTSLSVPPTQAASSDASTAAIGSQYHYVIVRRDLPLGVQAAMLVHAAGESGPASTGTSAVVLTVADEESLLSLHRSMRSIPHTLIKEVDPPYHGQAMAIGALVSDRSEIRKLTSSLPLLKQYPCSCLCGGSSEKER